MREKQGGSPTTGHIFFHHPGAYFSCCLCSDDFLAREPSEIENHGSLLWSQLHKQLQMLATLKDELWKYTLCEITLVRRLKLKIMTP